MSEPNKLIYESKPTCPCLLTANRNISIAATGIFCYAPPVFVGNPANLICHYPENLSQSRKNISVFQRDSIPGSREGEWDIIITIMDIFMAHDPLQDLGHNAPYRKMQKIYKHMQWTK